MNIFFIICTLLWLYVLSILIRGKLDFFKFIWGSVGLFILMIIWVHPILINPLTRLVTSVSGVIGKLSGMYVDYYEYSVLFITHNDTSISLNVDYECSGIIEIMAYLCMLAFFPLYNFSKKIILGILGIIWIFFSNVLRIFIICSMVYFFGSDVFYVSHTIIGRLVFYVLTIFFYYYIFTRSQILNQHIGGFQYAKDTESSVK